MENRFKRGSLPAAQPDATSLEKPTRYAAVLRFFRNKERRLPVIIALVILWPLGVFLLWKSNAFTKQSKRLISVILGVVVLLGTLAKPTNADQDNDDKRLQSSNAESPSNGDTLTPYAKAINQLSLFEPRVRSVLKKSFGSNLKKIEVIPRVEGGYYVRATYLEQRKGVISARIYRAIIERNMGEAYRNLFTSGITIQLAEIEAIMASVDRFGNDIEIPVYQTFLKDEEARKIRWERSSELDFSEILETRFLHPDLR